MHCTIPVDTPTDIRSWRYPFTNIVGSGWLLNSVLGCRFCIVVYLNTLTTEFSNVFSQAGISPNIICNVCNRCSCVGGRINRCWRSISNGCCLFIGKWFTTLCIHLEITTDNVEDGVVIERVDSTLICHLIFMIDPMFALAHDKYILETELLIFVRPLISYCCTRVEELCTGRADGSYATPFPPWPCHGLRKWCCGLSKSTFLNQVFRKSYFPSTLI